MENPAPIGSVAHGYYDSLRKHQTEAESRLTRAPNATSARRAAERDLDAAEARLTAHLEKRLNACQAEIELLEDLIALVGRDRIAGTDA